MKRSSGLFSIRDKTHAQAITYNLKLFCFRTRNYLANLIQYKNKKRYASVN